MIFEVSLMTCNERGNVSTVQKHVADKNNASKRILRGNLQVHIQILIAFVQ